LSHIRDTSTPNCCKTSPMPATYYLFFIALV
jgi:hypothetical protein